MLVSKSCFRNAFHACRTGDIPLVFFHAIGSSYVDQFPHVNFQEICQQQSYLANAALVCLLLPSYPRLRLQTPKANPPDRCWALTQACSTFGDQNDANGIATLFSPPACWSQCSYDRPNRPKASQPLRPLTTFEDEKLYTYTRHGAI